MLAVVLDTARRDERVAGPERLFREKHMGDLSVADGRHAWLRLTPEKTELTFREDGGWVKLEARRAELAVWLVMTSSGRR
jgi:hypothetical protein